MLTYLVGMNSASLAVLAITMDVTVLVLIVREYQSFES